MGISGVAPEVREDWCISGPSSLPQVIMAWLSWSREGSLVAITALPHGSLLLYLDMSPESLAVSFLELSLHSYYPQQSLRILGHKHYSHLSTGGH